MIVYPLSQGPIARHHQRQDVPLAGFVGVLSPGRLEPADLERTRQGVDLQSPDRTGDAGGDGGDADHDRGSCWKYCSRSGVSVEPRRPDQRWRSCCCQCGTNGRGLPWGCWGPPRSYTLRPMPERCGRHDSCRSPSRNRGGQSWTRRRVGRRRTWWA